MPLHSRFHPAWRTLAASSNCHNWPFSRTCSWRGTASRQVGMVFSAFLLLLPLPSCSSHCSPDVPQNHPQLPADISHTHFHRSNFAAAPVVQKFQKEQQCQPWETVFPSLDIYLKDRDMGFPSHHMASVAGKNTPRDLWFLKPGHPWPSPSWVSAGWEWVEVPQGETCLQQA